MDESPSRLVVGRHPWQQENAERHGAALTALADRLLALGGEAVVVPPDKPELVEVELALLLGGGWQDDGAAAVLELGEPSDCHANVVGLWRAGRGSICTGFALSRDLWRSHSWIAASGGTLIETTELRDVYFGIRLDNEAASIFPDTI